MKVPTRVKKKEFPILNSLQRQSSRKKRDRSITDFGLVGRVERHGYFADSVEVKTMGKRRNKDYFRENGRSISYRKRDPPKGGAESSGGIGKEIKNSGVQKPWRSMRRKPCSPQLPMRKPGNGDLEDHGSPNTLPCFEDLAQSGDERKLCHMNGHAKIEGKREGRCRRRSLTTR